MSEQKSGKRLCSKLKLHIVKQTGKENTYGNQSKTLTGLFILQKFIKGERDLEFVQTLLSICGAISIVGGAGAIIIKVVAPAFKLSKRVTQLEAYNEKDYKRLQSLEEMQKQQSKCLAAMLNHTITGNGIENMKKIRDELLENIIDK